MDDIPAIMQFVEKNWKENHILARDEEFFHWMYTCLLYTSAAPLINPIFDAIERADYTYAADLLYHEIQGE